jgi:hypothetical protein
MPFSTSNKVVSFYGGGQVDSPANVLVKKAAPPAAVPGSPVSDPVGTIWINVLSGNAYQLVQNTTAAGGVWTLLGGAAGAVATINSLAPTAGNIIIAGTANQITATSAGSTVTLSVPVIFSAPGTVVSGTGITATTGGVTATAGNIVATAGNISATVGSVSAGTTVTGGTGVVATTGNVSASAGAVNAATTMTATLGNITATNGNFVASTAGSGIVVPAATVAAGASPQTSNARAGRVVFNTVSIATNADQTFVINNTQITAATTVCLVTMHGAKTGTALSLKSVVSAASSLTITVTNGNGIAIVTQDTDLTFDYLVLNT